ncbi:MAG: efflux transporter outer membrane subunit [Halioglobus sp.]
MFTRTSIIIIAALLAGCAFTVGPQFEAPFADWEEDWVASKQPLSNLPVSAAADDALWWSQFDDPVLSQLIETALKRNHNLRIAGFRVIESRARLRGSEAAQRPQQVELSASSGKASTAAEFDDLSDADFRFVNAEFGIGWELDFWGRFQRAVEASQAGYLESLANFEDFKVILISEVARQYFTYATLQMRLMILERNAALQARSASITQSRYEAGEDSELNVQQARAQYLATVAAKPGLEDDLSQAQSALAQLLGYTDLPPSFQLNTSTNLTDIPDSIVQVLPADFLRRRPDVRAAYYRAAAASAAIGIAEAELYPSLSLFGSIGINQTSALDSVSASAGPALRWNIFDFGRIRNNIRVQDVRLEQALESYSETILQAAREVDDTAITFQKTQDQIALLEQSEAVSQRAYDIALIHFQEGFADFQRLLDAQATLLRQQDRLVAAQGLQAVVLTQVYKAMAGAWVTSLEQDYVLPTTRQKMRDRTNWGDLLTSPASGAGDNVQ